MNTIEDSREFRIETPVGTVVSDSGNHFLDIISVVGVIVLLLVLKRYIWTKN